MTGPLNLFTSNFSIDGCLLAIKAVATCGLLMFVVEVAVHLHYHEKSKQHPPHRKKRSRMKVVKVVHREEVELDDLLCPITLELPFEPVIAEDGRVYEKSAIERYFRGKRDREVRSCFTNEVMGRKLIPAPHVKDHIQRLIENGIISGQESQSWKRKTESEELLNKALTGDVEAMESVACRYFRGSHGFPRDKELAGYWSKKAHSGGSVFGMGMTGMFLANGTGCVKNEKEGVMYLAMAAGEGSDWAASKLGFALAFGKYGLEVNYDESVRLLKKSLSGTCSHQHMTKDSKRRAREVLTMLEAGGWKRPSQGRTSK
jgi:U-box domain